MFSSSTSTSNPLLQLPLPSTTAFHGGNHHILLPQIQDHYLFSPPPIRLLPNQHKKFNKPLLDNYTPKPVIKKDRHTKILTAQGHRDRRVRLSICIARKFFDLQDTLGFDKPSKTLNWLFSKSKQAIEELINAAAASSPSDADVAFKDGDSHEIGQRVKDSRAKARARARARTIKKMCIKELNEAKMLIPEPTKDPIIPRFCNAKCSNIVMKPESVWDIPQHLMMPKDLCLGYSHSSNTCWNNDSTIESNVSSPQDIVKRKEVFLLHRETETHLKCHQCLISSVANNS